jgi:hypothetical protein
MRFLLLCPVKILGAAILAVPILAVPILAAGPALAQAPAAPVHPAPTLSDAELIQMAMSAAPESVAKDAKIITVGHDGKIRVLRETTSAWTCMPGHGDPANPDPMCGDRNAMDWATAWMGKKEPPAGKVGFMYMLVGDGAGISNTDPHATAATADNNWIRTGPHVMIVGSGAKMLDGYPREAKADPAAPYVMWPGTPYEHLMLPVAAK